MVFLLIPAIFIASLSLSVGLHLNLPTAREALRSIITTSLSELLVGRFEIGAIVNLDPQLIQAQDLRVYDEQNKKVIEVKNLKIRLGIFKTIAQMLASPQKLKVRIPGIEFEDVWVGLYPEGDGSSDQESLAVPTLAHAFSVKSPTRESNESETTEVLFELPIIDLKNLRAESYLFGTPRISARVPQTQVKLKVEGSNVSIHLPHYEIDLKGLSQQGSSLAGDLRINVPGKISGSISGKVAGVGISEEFLIDGEHVDLRGEAPVIEPKNAVEIYPDWPFDQSVRVRHQFVGPLSELELRVDLSTSPTEQSLSEHLVLTGEANLVEPWSAELRLDTTALDLKRLRSDLPTTELHLRSDIHVEQGKDAPRVAIDATLLPSVVAQQSIPALQVIIDYENGKLSSDITLIEAGLPLKADLAWDGADKVNVAFTLERLSIQESSRLQALLPSLEGFIQGIATGQYSLEQQQFQGQLDLNISEVRHPTAEFKQAQLQSEVSFDVGHPEELAFDATLEGKNLTVGGIQLTEFNLEAQGEPNKADLQVRARSKSGAELELTTHYQRGSVELLDTHGLLKPKRGKPVTLDLKRFYLSEDELIVEGLALKSLGSIEGDFRHDNSSTEIRMYAHELNLTRILRVLELDDNYGALIDAQVEARLGKESTGSINISLKDAHYNKVHHAAAEAKVILDKQALEAHLSLELDGLGDIQSSAELVLAGDPRNAASYHKALGELKIEAHSLQLDFLDPALLPGLKRLMGSIDLNAFVSRSSSEQMPSTRVKLNTSKLAVVWEDEELPDLHDLDFDIDLETLDREHKLKVALKARDAFGELSASSAELELPLTKWNQQLPTTSIEWANTLASAPLEAVLSLRERSLKDLPAIASLPQVEGQVMARVTATGTFSEPILGVALFVKEFREESDLITTKLDADSQFTYRPASGSLKGSISATAQASRMGSASFDLVLPIEHLIENVRGKVPLWQGEVEIIIDELPTGLVTAMSESDFKGTVKGGLHITRHGWQPQLEADLDLIGLAVGTRPLGRGRVKVSTQGKRILASAKLRDAYGQLDCEASIPLQATRAAVIIDPTKALKAHLKSTNYDAAVLGPFVEPILSELSGALNGELDLSMMYGTEHAWETALNGKMRMNDGVILPKSMGLRMRDTALDLKITHKGSRNYLEVEQLQAKARSDSVNINGRGQMIFHNLDLESATFQIKQDKLPLLSDGVRLATVTGTTNIALKQVNGTYDLKVDFPSYKVELADSNDHDLISLEEDPNIEIYQPINIVRVTDEEKNTPFRLEFDLGEGVQIRNRFVDLTLTGEPIIDYHDDLSMSGIIELKPGGVVQVLGRKFVVEHGSVSFDGAEISDPFINTTAVWRTPGGSIIRATVSGTPSNLKVDWSSDPPIPGGESEIIAMVLGGGRSDDQGAGNMALAVAVNEALGQITNKIDVYTATESEGSDGEVGRLNERTQQSYTAAYQINDKVWVEGSYKVQSAQPGTEYRGFSGTVDWRFRDDWSMRTEAGELGVGLEMLWHYRY